jgi:hypothetical protein
MRKGSLLNLADAVPFWVVAAGCVTLAVIFIVGVFFVKKHPKANKEKEK